MAANEAKVDHGVEDLKQNMLSAYENRESADLTLVCGSQTFKIHSIILCPRSSFFRAAFEGGFKEGIAKRIELPEDDPHLINKLICYCYTTDYKFERDEFLSMGPKHAFYFPIHLHAGMYALAEKFDLKHLKKLAENKFRTSLELLDLEIAKAPPEDQTVMGLLEVIHYIYNTTLEDDRSLRDLVVGYVARHWSAFLDVQQLKTFIGANAGFIIEVIEAKKRVCNRCQKQVAFEIECSSLW